MQVWKNAKDAVERENYKLNFIYSNGKLQKEGKNRMKNGVNDLKITGNDKRQSEMIGNKALHFAIVNRGSLNK